MLTWISVAAVAVVLFLCRDLVRRFSADDIQALIEKRRAGSDLVSRGDFVDGNRRMTVALALTKQTLFYENKDMQASLDLEWVSEIDYDTSLSTGASVGDGEVLRLRCSSQCFEFILPTDVVARWRTMLPARRGAAPARESMIPRVAVATV